VLIGKWVGRPARHICVWLLVPLFLFFFHEIAFAAQSTARWGAAPPYVVDAPMPTPNPSRLREVENGHYDLLYDTQVRVDGEVETTYRRRAYKVVDRSGLEDAAQIDIDFDPTHEGVVIHHVRIIRDGRTISVRDEVAIDILRKEKEIDDGILTGVRTALLRLPAVRVGDVIDVGWSWIGRPSLWPGQYFGSMQLNWSVPVAFTRYRVDLPATNDFAVYRHRGAPAARRVVGNGRDLIEWIAIDPDPVVEDDGAPQWHRPWRRVALSTMPQWSQVVQWALPLYADASAFPSEFSDELTKIEREGRNPRVRAIKALRLVQDRIRYTSLSIGPGSYRPRSPAQVVHQGWGDCKDKAQLLVSVLRQLGIEAYPALTDSDEGAALATRIPSPIAFDHVIVEIRIDGRSYWVDPTISHQGGDLANLASLPYRYALPIRPRQRGLVSIPLSILAKPNVEAIETYLFEPNGIRLDAITYYTGAAADETRASFANTAHSEKEASYLRFYAGRYPGLELRASLAVTDDRESNSFVVRERYWLPAKAYADGKLFEAFVVNAVTLSELFTDPEGGRRNHPLALTFPVHRTHKIVLVARDLSIPAPDEINVDGDAFSFALTTDRSGDKLTILFSLIGKTSVIQASDFAAFRADTGKLAENLEWSLTLTPGSPSLGLSGLMLVAIGALAALFLAGLVHARKQRNAFNEGESFYPVPLRKFVPLSIASWGLYTFYWFWRNWNWVKQRLGEDIRPFWRAFFGPFWLHPLFNSANGRFEKRVPIWLGITGSVMFLIWTVGTSVADRIYENSMVPTVIGTLAGIFVIPALVAVNRNNSTETVLSNGRFGWLGLGILILGPCTMLLMLFVD
jgi:hypothetical protein